MRPPNLSILCIEDEPDHAELLRLALERIPGVVLAFRAEADADAGLRLASESSFDAVFVDHALGARNGEDVARVLRERGYRGPIVLVTAHWRSHLQAVADRCGADAYLNKAYLTPRSLVTALSIRVPFDGEVPAHGDSPSGERLRDVDGDAAVVIDEAALDARGLAEAERAVTEGASFAVLWIRAELGGRPVSAVTEMAARIARICRATDVLGRVGDDLVILCPRTPSRGASVLAARMLDAANARERRYRSSSAMVRAVVSVGAASSCERSWTEVKELARIEVTSAADAGGAQIRVAREGAAVIADLAVAAP